MHQGRVWLLLGAMLAAACSSDERPRFTGGKPLPECPSIELTPCDTLSAACQERLLSLAACMYGVEQKPDVPIRVATVDELVDELEASSPDPSDPSADESNLHFERAMSELLLMQPGDVTGDGGSAEDFVERVDGYYVDAEHGITLVDRGMPKNTTSANALLLHELIHAVQDAEYDLDSWEADEPLDYDAFLARRSVSEGQATLYQFRAAVAMTGRDVSTIDWEASFEELRDEILADGLRDPSPYFAGPLTFPYAHGAMVANRAWHSDGLLYHRAQFGSPPRRTLDVMNESLQKSAVEAAPELVEPARPDDYVSVDREVMGAFILQLLAHRAGATVNQAQELALAWRSDTLWISYNGDKTAYLWELAFDTPEHVEQLRALPDLPANVTLEAAGERLFLAGSGTPPDFLLEAGRSFLAAAASQQ